MAALLLLALSALAGPHLASAQLPIPGMPGMGFPQRMGSQFPGNNLWGGNGPFNRRYATCTAVSPSNDVMKITLTEENSGSSSMGWGGWNSFNYWGAGLRLLASVSSTSIGGNFQLAMTQFGRVEMGCYSAALGNIYGPRQQQAGFWNNAAPFGQQMSERGILGSSFTVNPGQTAQLSEDVPDLTYDEVLGNAVILCNTQSMASGQCRDPIPLCCKLGKDLQPANQQIMGFGGGFMMGNQNNMMGGNLNTVMNTGANAGLNALNTGLATNTGLTGTTGGTSMALNQGSLFSGKK